MEQHTTTITPFYEKSGFILVSLFVLCIALSYGRVIILPILFGILLASLLLPITRYLTARNFNGPTSILIPLITTILVVGTLFFLVSSQVINFLDDLPTLKDHVNQLSAMFQKWVKESTHITIQKQNQYWSKSMENFQDQLPTLLETTVTSVVDALNYILLIPLYTFFVLYYRGTIRKFLIQTFRNGSEEKVKQVLSESTTVAQHYLRGLLIETAIVFTLNLIGFLIIGVKYKVLLALLAALLNLIPYLGMLIANVLCMTSALITSENPRDALWVGVALALVQIFDNNFGMPLIVGNKVRINAMVTIVGVIVGGALCGIPGMFIAIPGLAVLKIICDKVPELKPWGMLLGDDSENKKPKLALIKQKIDKNHSEKKVATL